MDKNYSGTHYTSEYIEDFKDGFGALDLYATISGGVKERVARATYWDAMGKCTLEVFGAQAPKEILDEILAECYARNSG
jgi:hypothetical protein